MTRLIKTMNELDKLCKKNKSASYKPVDKLFKVNIQKP